MRLINADDVLSIVDDLRDRMTVEGYCAMTERVKALPSAQPELIEQGAYVRGFEQGRTQGMIDNTIKAEWTNADALDLQPTCNRLATDYISRQAAIRVASGYCHPANIAKELAKLPSAQPERKTGRWIEQDDSWDGVYYECSACGEPWTLIDGTPWDNGMNFCPNCGADMRGEGEK